MIDPVFSESPQNTLHPLEVGSILLINKPAGWTSFDVVNKIRGAIKHHLGLKKIKVGHSGTLDPMATGLLLLGTGKCTRDLDSLQELGKCYEGTITLGATTPTYDAESEPDELFPFQHITREDLEAELMHFQGELMQVPPIFSAIKVGGQPLYKKARKGEVFEPEARKITLYSLEILRFELPEIDFRVHCSKGTYIRSLAFDLGKSLQSGAYLSRLVRTKIGSYDLKEAVSPEKFIESIISG
ncbi:MAG: tRNA pseudouridine(55) synthase TruB [Saprospiraceae bacterium]|nr:tRNA pseudouridine(55) synthase TruB [Saprospiraceae bacterium]